MKNLESLIKTYNDFPKKGIAFKDILGLIHDPEVFRELILKMSSNKVIKGTGKIRCLVDTQLSSSPGSSYLLLV